MPRLPIADILHRGVVYSLVGLSVYGVVIEAEVGDPVVSSSKNVFSSSERTEILKEREALGLPTTLPKKELSEEVEETLAQQATAIFKKRSTVA
ncbi:hypothetical protein D9613_000997 [Agrocybe pediades]|uniref:Uncharacterized protein n=1 Tax=Agrocybe pediades TaxID=84607 RepID=A0A8H4R2P4_9AGAR|nr:hypothetical protein D9613_000997 [Agrocybe pediades]